MKQKEPVKKNKLTADEFNRKYPVGSKVKYYHDLITVNHVITKTTSVAMALMCGTAIVSLEGVQGKREVYKLEFFDQLTLF